jgi:predicted RNA binding protein YcfA (HicA-like mRNA interferase family)
MNPEKILAQARNNPKDVRFSDLLGLAEALGYRFDRQNGSHRVYIHPAVPKVLNVQAVKGGKAKEYQVKELLRAIETYALRLREDPS